MISNPESLQPKEVISDEASGDFKMSGFGMCSASVICLLVFLTGQGSALFWRPAVYPTNPEDPYYQGKFSFMFLFPKKYILLTLSWL